MKQLQTIKHKNIITLERVNFTEILLQISLIRIRRESGVSIGSALRRVEYTALWENDTA